MKEKKAKLNRTYIGGQAVMEGVMMRGKQSMAMAVRDPEGVIQMESERLTPPEAQNKFFRAPFVRGVVNFVKSLVDGSRIIMRSADVAEVDEEEQTKGEKWLKEKHKVDVSGAINVGVTVASFALALFLFLWLPSFLTGLLPDKYFNETYADGKWLPVLWYNLTEGGIRLAIFTLYIIFMSVIPSLRRVFMYHGAEHKTITCFEKGKELTVANVKSCSRVHDRCGTTFLFIVVIVSILIFTGVNLLAARYLYIQDEKLLNNAIRFGLRLLFLPLVAGVSYEILRLLAKTDSKFFLPFKLPGLLLQRLTTREPEDDMIECAIAAFEMVRKMDEDPTVPERVFATAGKMTALLRNTKKRFRDNGIDEEEAEWIFALSLGIPKSAVSMEERILRVAQAKEIVRIADERLTGRPLWYIIGDTDFCGYKLKVDERVLIPRPETEEMVMMAVGAAEDGFNILDMCTGSGAIAIALFKELERRNRNVKVTAVDISEEALELAKENAKLNFAEIRFLQSDLFSKVRGKFDIIVSNPPYIPSAEIETLQREVRDYEPRLALDGGEDGLDFYRRLAEEAPKHLTKDGILIMEVGAGEAKDIVKLFKDCSYSIIVKDFNGIERYVKIVMDDRKKK